MNEPHTSELNSRCFFPIHCAVINPPLTFSLFFLRVWGRPGFEATSKYSLKLPPEAIKIASFTFFQLYQTRELLRGRESAYCLCQDTFDEFQANKNLIHSCISTKCMYNSLD